jgi:uncharacterized HAD superfamily protein
MKAKLMLDLDGVIAMFAASFQTYLNQHYGCDFDTTQDPIAYGFENWGHGVDKIDVNAASVEWMRNDGFANVASYPGAEEFVAALMNAYDVYIVTARVGDWEQKLPKDLKNRVKQNTYEWLKARNIPITHLHFIHDKIPFCQEHGISVIVEDKLETALKAAKEGIHTVLIDRGYNQSKVERLRVYRVFNFNEALTQIAKLVQ